MVGVASSRQQFQAAQAVMPWYQRGGGYQLRLEEGLCGCGSVTISGGSCTFEDCAMFVGTVLYGYGWLGGVS